MFGIDVNNPFHENSPSKGFSVSVLALNELRDDWNRKVGVKLKNIRFYDLLRLF